MEDANVELPNIPVLRVKADMKGRGPSAAFDLLESKLPTLKGRKFYGSFQPKPDGEEYYACAARIDSDDSEKDATGDGNDLGGWYARRKLPDWEKNLSKLPSLFQEMARTHDVDREPVVRILSEPGWAAALATYQASTLSQSRIDKPFFATRISPNNHAKRPASNPKRVAPLRMTSLLSYGRKQSIG